MIILEDSITKPTLQRITALTWKVDELKDKLANVQEKLDNALTRKPK
jgi:hypothetical protein